MTETSIEFIYYLARIEIDLSACFALLPKQISTVKLIGQYVSGLIDVSQSDEPLPILKSVSEIPTELAKHITYLPASVHSLAIQYTYDPNNKDIIDLSSLAKLVSRVPPHIIKLNLVGTDFQESSKDDVAEVFEYIPSSIKSLTIRISQFNLLENIPLSLSRDLEELVLDGCMIGRANSTNTQTFDLFYSNLPRNLKKLSLRHNELSRARHKNAISFSGLPQSLIELDLSFNNLGNLSKTDLISMFLSLPRNLSVLEFQSNDKDGNISKRPEYLFQALNGAPRTIQELNLRDNNLLNSHLFITALLQLAPNVRQLDIFESKWEKLSSLQCASSIQLIPEKIEILSFKKNKELFAKSMEKLKSLLSNIPKTVTTLDFSELELYKWKEASLLHLAEAIPSHIATLLLCKNGLNCINLAHFKKFLSRMPLSVQKITVIDNGLDEIPGEQFHLLLEQIPEHMKLIFDSNQFYTKLNGSCFKLPPYKLITKGPAHSSAEQQPVSDKKFDPLLKNVQRRIAELSPDANQLDLSNLQLNQISSFSDFTILLESVPTHVLSINLRNNSLYNQADGGCLMAVLKCIPEKMVHIDMSGYKLEYTTAEQLRALFATIPMIQYVSLISGKPLSPAEHIEVRTWPSSFARLLSTEPNLLAVGRKLLDDYTMGDSALLRFLFLHWNRSHIAEVSRIVKLIDKGLIQSQAEFFKELESIKRKNNTGDLSKRYSFLHQLSLWNKEPQDINKDYLVQSKNRIAPQ